MIHFHLYFEKVHSKCMLAQTLHWTDLDNVVFLHQKRFSEELAPIHRFVGAFHLHAGVGQSPSVGMRGIAIKKYMSILFSNYKCKYHYKN